MTIISLNSSNDISPFPSESTSLTIYYHTYSLIFLPTPNTSFISSILIEPLLSLSYILNAYCNFSSFRRLLRFTVAVTNSEKSISPLLSTSTNANILSTSFFPTSPKNS